jgi:hypothetical protein
LGTADLVALNLPERSTMLIGNDNVDHNVPKEFGEQESF